MATVTSATAVVQVPSLPGPGTCPKKRQMTKKKRKEKKRKERKEKSIKPRACSLKGQTKLTKIWPGSRRREGTQINKTKMKVEK